MTTHKFETDNKFFEYWETHGLKKFHTPVLKNLHAPVILSVTFKSKWVENDDKLKEGCLLYYETPTKVNCPIDMFPFRVKTSCNFSKMKWSISIERSLHLCDFYFFTQKNISIRFPLHVFSKIRTILTQKSLHIHQIFKYENRPVPYDLKICTFEMNTAETLILWNSESDPKFWAEIILIHQ